MKVEAKARVVEWGLCDSEAGPGLYISAETLVNVTVTVTAYISSQASRPQGAPLVAGARHTLSDLRSRRSGVRPGQLKVHTFMVHTVQVRSRIIRYRSCAPSRCLHQRCSCTCLSVGIPRSASPSNSRHTSPRPTLVLRSNGASRCIIPPEWPTAQRSQVLIHRFFGFQTRRQRGKTIGGHSGSGRQSPFLLATYSPLCGTPATFRQVRMGYLRQV